MTDVDRAKKMWDVFKEGVEDRSLLFLTCTEGQASRERSIRASPYYANLQYWIKEYVPEDLPSWEHFFRLHFAPSPEDIAWLDTLESLNQGGVSKLVFYIAFWDFFEDKESSDMRMRHLAPLWNRFAEYCNTTPYAHELGSYLRWKGVH